MNLIHVPAIQGETHILPSMFGGLRRVTLKDPNGNAIEATQVLLVSGDLCVVPIAIEKFAPDFLRALSAEPPPRLYLP